jgi:mRNA interferase MazF
MQAGDITLIPIRQADGQTKTRPVLLLKQVPPYGDWLVCGVSRQLRHECEGFDHIILDTDPIFAQTGLREPSLIRLGFLDVFDQVSMPGAIGNVGAAVVGTMLKRLATHLLS